MFGLPFGQLFQTDDGRLVKRVRGTDCPTKGSYLLHVGLCHNTVETTVSIVDGQPRMNPIWVPNNVFVDERGNYLIRSNEKTEDEDAARAAEVGAGYIINRKVGGAMAYKNGKQIDMPKLLTNEFGVGYNVIDFRTYGLACMNLLGYDESYKVEPVYLISEIVGTPVSAVINGVDEHKDFVEEGEVLVQNAYHGERYKQKREKFEKSYELTDEVVSGYQVWKPRRFDTNGNEIIQKWTITDENIVGGLWGGFELLGGGAAINVTDKNDVYGCNRGVYLGNDTAKGSHKRLRHFAPVNQLSHEQAMAMLARCREDLSFAQQVAEMNPEFVEVPLGICEVERQFRSAM